MRCINCYAERTDNMEMCPFCGYIEGEEAEDPFILAVGTLMHNRYRIGMKIAMGGFGITYKGWDEKLERVVAVKEYYPNGLVSRNPGESLVRLYVRQQEKAYQHGKERFIEEAKNLAKFNDNPHIVDVIEYFDENNTSYYVMEYLDGPTIEKYIQNRNISIDETVHIILAVCDALKACHKLGILHRDVAPDNIIICKDGKIKLIDFGAARLSADDKNLTIVLKPGYAPPEQYVKSNDQKAYTDIYGLGATMYLMLTGQKPEEAINRKIVDTLQAPNEIDKDIPEYISTSVMRAMAVDTFMRFQTVDEFERAIKHETTVLTEKNERRKRGNKRILGLGIAAIIVIGGLGIFLYSFHQQRVSNTLPDGTIQVWYEKCGNQKVDQGRQKAYETIATNFMNSYTNVTINVVGIDANLYQEKLNNALDTEKMPNLFETSGIDLSDIEVEDLKKIVNKDLVEQNYFFDEYESYYPDHKQIPLGFAFPAVFVNNSLAEYSGETVTAISDIQAITDVTKIAVPEDYAILYASEVALSEPTVTENREEFYDNEAVYMLSSTADYLDVQSYLSGQVTMLPITISTDSVIFDMEMSICNQSKAENRIAESFLQYLLSDSAQDYLYVQNSCGYWPINKADFEIMKEIYPDLDDFIKSSDYTGLD